MTHGVRTEERLKKTRKKTTQSDKNRPSGLRHGVAGSPVGYKQGKTGGHNKEWAPQDAEEPEDSDPRMTRGEEGAAPRTVPRRRRVTRASTKG